jgi:dephospho-CoA kinase
VALDVPLLLETGGARRCDAVVVVAAPAFLQAQRVLRRPGMTVARLEEIRRRQMPDARKRRLADLVVPTGLGKGPVVRRMRRFLAAFKARSERGRWPPVFGRE